VIVAVMMVRRWLCVMIIGLDADDVDRAEPNPSLSSNLVSKSLNLGCRPAQEHCFQARIVIEYDVRDGNHQCMMGMLQVEQACRKRSSPMIIDIAEACHTGACRRPSNIIDRTAD
jgi:hypothetical protein